MKDPNLILQEQVFPALDSVEAGQLSDEDAIKGLQQAVRGMLEASNLKLEMAEDPEKRESLLRLQQDLITLDVYLSLYDQAGTPIPESLQIDFARIVGAWETNGASHGHTNL